MRSAEVVTEPTAAPAQSHGAAADSSMAAVVARATPSDVTHAVWPEGKPRWLPTSVTPYVPSASPVPYRTYGRLRAAMNFTPSARPPERRADSMTMEPA